MKDFNEIETFGAKDVVFQSKWIDDYKRKKINENLDNR